MHHLSILLIEPDERRCSERTALLSGAGYRVAWAGTALYAREQLRLHSPDLLIVSAPLPDMDSILLCSMAQEIHPGLHILLLVQEPIEAVPEGIERVLKEPVPYETLLTETERLLPRPHPPMSHAAHLDAQSQLVMATRQAAIGELVAQIAHELNNPLAIILGSAELLPAQQHPDDQQLVQQIIESTRRAGQVMQSLALFARDHTTRKGWCEPARLIQYVLTLRQWAFNEHGIKLKTDISPTLPLIWADDQHFQQMIINVLINAETALARVRDPHLSVMARFVADLQELQIEIADNGPGIDPVLQERIFDPLVTTERHRLGMGLTIARAIVADHHGTIMAVSQVGRGATFRITLPIQPWQDGTMPPQP